MVKNADLLNLLRRYEMEVKPVGFSYWRECDKSLWGYVKGIEEHGIWFLDIDTLGQIKEEPEFWRWSELMEVDFELEYGRRLQRFKDFTPTVPDLGKWQRSAKDRDRILRDAIQLRRVARIRKPGGSQPTIIPRSIDGGFMLYTELDNYCIEHSQAAIRLSLLEAVREFDAMAEAETWLWRQNYETEKA
jgi:hypothetical protein